MKKVYFLLSFLFATLGATDLDHKLCRRAAFDIGSGRIKMQVSDVDPKTSRIVNVLFVDTAEVPIREDLIKSPDGNLSASVQNKTLAAISELVKKALPHKPEAYHGIATEGLRLAKNGREFAAKIQKETGVKVTIASQEEEGILGFISAIQAAKVDPEKAVSWDFGGGSFQITAKSGDHYHVYQGRLGRVPLKLALLKIQGKEERYSPNPISKKEAMLAIAYIKEAIQGVPLEILKKLEDPQVKVLGIGIHPLWGMPKSSTYDLKRVMAEIDSRLGISDDDALRSIHSENKEAAAYVVSNLILAYGVMEALHMREVTYVGTQGANATGALVSPKYWNEK